MPHKRWAQHAPVLAAEFTPYVADQIVAQYPNAAARSTEWGATTPPTGSVSALDTNPGTLYVWTGTQWVRADWYSAWGLVAPPALKITPQTIGAAWVDVAGCAITFTALAGRRYRATGQIPVLQAAGSSGVQNSGIRDAANTVLASTGATSNPSYYITHTVILPGYSPVAGPATLKLSFGTNAATADLAVNAGQPAFLTVEDVGPTGPPT